MSNIAEVKEKVNGTKILSVFDFMKEKKDLIQAALPHTITPERLIGVFTMVLKSSPALAQ